jgi:hypothetical protein
MSVHASRIESGRAECRLLNAGCRMPQGWSRPLGLR